VKQNGIALGKTSFLTTGRRLSSGQRLAKSTHRHVKTDFGVVLEFQHSPLHRDEREARENFYQKMVWVVDGLRRASE
jgi:hypothetical protein